MQVPLELSFPGLDQSDALEALVRERVAKLDRLTDRLVACRVAVERPHKQHRTGNLYHVRILMSVPQDEIVISRDPGANEAHEDVYQAVRDAFDAAERRLKSYRRKIRGEVKHHDAPLQGRIRRLFPQQSYGFIETHDGREIYFHEHALVEGGIGDLEEGQTVELVVFAGDSPQGPHASTVRPIRPMSYQPQG